MDNAIEENSQTKKVPFKWQYGEIEVSLVVDMYVRGNGLCILLIDETEYGNVFARMTVNLPQYSLDPNVAFIDADISDDLLTFIRENDLGDILPFKGISGYRHYRAVSFSLDKLKAFDPDGVSRYLQHHGIKE